MKKILFLGIVLFLGLLVVVDVDATCTLTLDDTAYVEGETAAGTGNCGASNEKSRAYTITWTNGSGTVLQTDVGTTPSAVSTPFIVNYIIPVGYVAGNGTVLDVNMTGTNLEGTDTATIAGPSSNDLIVSQINISSGNYIGTTLGISARIQNSTEQGVLGATCSIHIEDTVGNAITSKKADSTHDGEIHLYFPITEAFFDADAQYLADINCYCPTGSTTQCFNAEIGASGQSLQAFNIDDLGDAMIIRKWSSGDDFVTGAYPTVWLNNEFDGKTEIVDGPTNIPQENIGWLGYNNTLHFNSTTNGQGFLTAGHPASLCLTIENTFEVEKFVMISQVSFDDDTIGQHFFPESVETGEELSGEHIILRTSIKPNSTDGPQTVCSQELLMPEHVFGANDIDINFHLNVEGFEQNIEGESDEFAYFAQQIGKDYVNWITINNFTFIETNATEGEPVQLLWNVSSNHPNHPVLFKLTYEMLSDFSRDLKTERVVQTFSPDFPNRPIDGAGFVVFGDIPPGLTNELFESPLFNIPYDLFDRDLTDVVGMNFEVMFGSSYQFDIELDQDEIPTIDIIGKQLDVFNVSTSVGVGGSTLACNNIDITFEYDNPLSNATVIDNEKFVANICTDDVLNNIYLDCTSIVVDPLVGDAQSSTFSIPVPPLISSGETTVEYEVWVYNYEDESDNTGDCLNCGELVEFYSASTAQFNVTPNTNSSCTYSSDYFGGGDKTLQLLDRQATALESIENKTGVFLFELACPASASGGIDCTLAVQVEDPSVTSKETQFYCYLENEESGIQFNQLINNSLSEIDISLSIPTRYIEGESYTAYCEADYFNFGQIHQETFDSFLINSGSTDSAFRKSVDKVGDLLDLTKTGIFEGACSNFTGIFKKFCLSYMTYAIILLFLLVCTYFIFTEEEEKKKK